ncbi:MAG: tetratricopeptide repeat protein [Bacteroidales bacterium]|nr:tetratricopeptide repeat protein [Bacteroidales bacterium]
MKQLFILISLFFISFSTLSQNPKLIDSLISEGNYLLALEDAKDLVNKDSLNAEFWELYGKANRLNHRFIEAIGAYKKANQLKPEDKRLLLILAKTYRTAENLQKAINTYKKVLGLDSNNIAAQINLANLYLKTQKIKEAYPVFEHLYLSDTLNSEYIRLMGYCKYRQGDILEAFKLYRKSYQVNPENLKTIYWLADIYTNSQKYDSTINMVTKALKVYHDNGRLYAKRGDAYYRRGHYYRSKDDYTSAINFDYKSYQVQKRLGKSLYAIKKYDEARKTLEKLIMRDTNDFQVCMYLGGIYNELKNYQKSLLFYEYALDLLLPAPMTMAAVYRGMAETYHGLGQYHNEITAIKKWQKYRSQVYPLTEYLLEIAEIYDKSLDDKRNAIKFYTKYYEQIKAYEADYWQKKAEKALARINQLKEDLHFEK